MDFLNTNFLNALSLKNQQQHGINETYDDFRGE